LTADGRWFDLGLNRKCFDEWIPLKGRGYESWSEVGEGAGNFAVKEIETPSPGDGEVLFG
jgi:hypothetical protein